MLLVPLALCVSVAATPAPAKGASIPDLVRRLDPSARASLAHGQLRFLRLGELAGAPAPAGAALPDRAAALIDRFAPAFGLRSTARDLRLERVEGDALGFQRLSYAQQVAGVPVYGGGLRVHVDGSGRVRTIEGLVVPDLAIDPTPRVSAGVAAEHARAFVAGEAPGDTLETVVHGLYAFRTGLARAPTGGTDHLAWRVEVRGRTTRAFAFVDAHTGKVVEVQHAREMALSREVHQGSLAGNIVWVEGDPLPSGQGADLDRIVAAAGDVYAMYWNLSGGTRASYDGRDSTMMSVWKLADPNNQVCPNAFWDGTATNFCDGVSAIDSVAHEWSHAYTEYTDNLAYMWQPGALNEAYSDIFGETVDLLWSGATENGVPRGDDRCSSLAGPPPPILVVASPPSLAATYRATGASFGPSPSSRFPMTGTLVPVNDATGDPADACETLQPLGGSIALIRRGTCNFTDKVKRAQDAGAVAAVVYDNLSGDLVTMGGDDATIVIPSIFVAASTGEALAAAGSAQVTLDVLPPDTSTDPSYRWLIGETDPAFGAALRDMWDPACIGGPGKVSDASYECTTTDEGGVHTNSTVPSHAYALLVDGGTYNGVTVGAVGLDKAAQIYWRAKAYQGPYTGFAEHADALDLACEDLVGHDVPDLVTGAASGQPVTATDCTQVAAAESAVELRTSPGQCQFQPLLAADAPALCAPTATLMSDDFETDGGWTVDSLGVYPEFRARTWERRTDLPGGRPGWAYYAAAPDGVGNCVPNNDDQAGVFYLTSPEMRLPSSADGLVLAFSHYVATESDIDGGIVRVSVEGARWQTIQANAFTFNPYNAKLAGTDTGNDNPLAGIHAFSGTDGGTVQGSWGQSQASLATLVKPGQKFRIQFLLGVDGCGGIDGWYVDDVKLLACAKVVEDKGGCAALPPLWSVLGTALALAGAGVRRRRAS